MSYWLRQSTGGTIPLGPFVGTADGYTAGTALTISQAEVRLSKNGAAFAQVNGTANLSHMENGYYALPLDATDTNTLGRLRVAVNESAALPVWQDFMIVPSQVWDSFFATDTLQVHAVEIANGLITAASIATDAIDADALAADAIAEINATVDTALSDYDGPTKAEVDAAVAALATAADLTTVASYLDTEIAAILADTNELQTDWVNGGRLDLLIDQIITNIAALNNISTADVNAQVLDVLNVDTFAEPSAVPAATASLAAKLGWIMFLARNKITQTATTQTVFADDGTTAVANSTVSDDGTTATRGEWADAA